MVCNKLNKHPLVSVPFINVRKRQRLNTEDGQKETDDCVNFLEKSKKEKEEDGTEKRSEKKNKALSAFA